MENIVGIFTMLASIATTLCAYIAFKTLYEVKRQRESTYLPDIIIGEENLYVYFRNKDGVLEPAEYSYENKNKYYHQLGRCESNFYLIKLKFYNIGLATAKEMKIEYFFDKESIQRSIDKSFNVSRNFKVEMNKNDFEFFEGETKVGYGYYSINEKFNYVGYLMPITVSEKSFVCDAPNLASALLLCMIDPSEHYELQEKGIIMCPVEPLYVLDGLKVRISYKDINNKSHVKLYNVSLTSGWMTGYKIEFKISAKVLENSDGNVS